MSYVAKHHPNKKGKSYYIKRSRVNLLIRWYSICIHYLLRNLKHTVRTKFTWRHSIALYYIENQRRKVLSRLNVQGKLFRWNIQPKPHQWLRCLSSRQWTVNLSLLLCIYLHFTQPTSNSSFSYPAHLTYMFTNAIKSEILHCFNFSNLRLNLLQLLWIRSSFFWKNKTVKTSKQSIYFWHNNIMISFGAYYNTCHLIS